MAIVILGNKVVFMFVMGFRLADAREEISRLQARCGVVEDYERKVQKLRDELYLNAVDKGHYLPSPEPRYIFHHDLCFYALCSLSR